MITIDFDLLSKTHFEFQIFIKEVEEHVGNADLNKLIDISRKTDHY